MSRVHFTSIKRIKTSNVQTIYLKNEFAVLSAYFCFDEMYKTLFLK